MPRSGRSGIPVPFFFCLSRLSRYAYECKKRSVEYIRGNAEETAQKPPWPASLLGRRLRRQKRPRARWRKETLFLGLPECVPPPPPPPPPLLPFQTGEWVAEDGPRKEREKGGRKERGHTTSLWRRRLLLRRGRAAACVEKRVRREGTVAFVSVAVQASFSPPLELRV